MTDQFSADAGHEIATIKTRNLLIWLVILNIIWSVGTVGAGLVFMVPQTVVLFFAAKGHQGWRRASSVFWWIGVVFWSLIFLAYAVGWVYTIKVSSEGANAIGLLVAITAPLVVGYFYLWRRFNQRAAEVARVSRLVESAEAGVPGDLGSAESPDSVVDSVRDQEMVDRFADAFDGLISPLEAGLLANSPDVSSQTDANRSRGAADKLRTEPGFQGALGGVGSPPVPRDVLNRRSSVCESMIEGIPDPPDPVATAMQHSFVRTYLAFTAYMAKIHPQADCDLNVQYLATAVASHATNDFWTEMPPRQKSVVADTKKVMVCGQNPTQRDFLEYTKYSHLLLSPGWAFLDDRAKLTETISWFFSTTVPALDSDDFAELVVEAAQMAKDDIYSAYKEQTT